jgi:hypothetical protein
VRSFVVELRVGRLPRVEPVDVAVVHAEGCCDEDGVVDREVRCAFGSSRFDVRARDGLAVDGDLAGDAKQCTQLGFDRGVVEIPLDLVDQIPRPSSALRTFKALCG